MKKTVSFNFNKNIIHEYEKDDDKSLWWTNFDYIIFEKIVKIELHHIVARENISINEAKKIFHDYEYD